MGDGSAGREMVIVGLISIAALFVIYARYQNSELLTPDAIESIQRIAYLFYVALAASFGAVGLGMYRYHRGKAVGGGRGLSSIIAQATWNGRSRRVFAATFAGYGIFFALVSGTLVYQPEVTFSVHYGAEIPSGFIAPCCGEFGYMPKIIIYMTEHVGLQVIPVNLVLQVAVSYLVALNASIAVSAYAVSRQGGGMSGVGAAVGAFVACPTCAGTFFSLFIGTASGIALSLALAQLQTLLIAVSIPILLVTPYVMARRLRSPDGSCGTVPGSGPADR